MKNGLRPQTARPQHDAPVDHVPAEDLRKGDVVLVKPGIYPAMAKSSKAAPRWTKAPLPASLPGDP